ncbi:S49 family peptidase, partial [bacterium]|nr:S49 family peptidase [bacterium]
MEKRHILIFALSLLLVSAVFAQEIETDFPDYSAASQVLTATPGTQGGALGAVWNPAAWAAMRGSEIAFSWNDRNVSNHRMDNWGLYAGGHGIGFSMRRSDFLRSAPINDVSGLSEPQRGRIDDYAISLGGGEPDDYWGLSYGWSKGDTDYLSRDNMLTLGNISRPFRYLSVGNAASIGLKHGDLRGISDIGVRPFGTHCLTLFADAAYRKYDNATTMHWGTGAEIMPLDGFRVAAKLTKPSGFSQDKIFSISLGLTLDDVGFHVTPHYDHDSERMSTSYLIRLGDLAPKFDLDRFNRDERVVSLNMKGHLTYQTSRWYDPDRHAMLELLNNIEKAKMDTRVDGLALNLSGFSGSREMMWELREALQGFKQSGKKVYIYFDRAGMTLYYFASVADYLWIDPQGSIMVPGFHAGRTFWKGFMEKIGLGVEEWRFFDYKSAFESLARREMSEKDREQRLALINDFYEEWERGITEGRDLTPEQLRACVDTLVFIRPQDALSSGLVDTIGRWDDVNEFVEALSGNDAKFVNKEEGFEDRFADQNWGKYPQIAVVYALGECDMDSGIRGRYTSRLLRKLSKSDKIEAVVLRVDSPGGDPLPSDLVAAEMETVSEKKPMIVSQGSVAGSGGYWISMNADKIYTSPFSITGSIGVIAGWVWNEGLTDKTGFTYDYVQIGDHADLGNGVTLPFLGITVPDRNLDEEEKGRMEWLIKDLYHGFVGAVATARDLDTSYVGEIAQGRIWSGQASLDNKL